MEEDEISTVFDQLLSTKADNGVGIGLYMSKKIIEDSFKGKISVENSEQGVVFTIVLPMK